MGLGDWVRIGGLLLLITFALYDLASGMTNGARYPVALVAIVFASGASMVHQRTGSEPHRRAHYVLGGGLSG